MERLEVSEQGVRLAGGGAAEIDNPHTASRRRALKLGLMFLLAGVACLGLTYLADPGCGAIFPYDLDSVKVTAAGDRASHGEYDHVYYVPWVDSIDPLGLGGGARYFDLGWIYGNASTGYSYRALACTRNSWFLIGATGSPRCQGRLCIANVLYKGSSNKSLPSSTKFCRDPSDVTWHATTGPEPVPQFLATQIKVKEGENFTLLPEGYTDVMIWFFVCFALFSVRGCMPLWPPSRDCMTRVTFSMLGMLPTLLVYLLVRLIYVSTDCQDAVKGPSDVLLGFGGLGVFFGVLSFCCMRPGQQERDMEDLLGRLSRACDQQDHSALVLQVSPARQQRFLTADIERDADVQSTTEYHEGACGKCCRYTLYILAVPGWILIVVAAFLDGHEGEGRAAAWSRAWYIPPLFFLLILCTVKLVTSPQFQRCRKRQHLQARLAKATEPAQIVFFSNAEDDTSKVKAVVFWNKCLVASFSASEDIPGVLQRTTKTSIQADDTEANQQCALLCFTAIQVHQTRALGRSETRVEATGRIPLDEGQSTVVQEFLNRHQQAFNFGEQELEIH